MVRRVAASLVLALAFVGLVAGPSSARPDPVPPSSALHTYVGSVDAAGLSAIVELGVDRSELVLEPGVDGSQSVEVIVSGDQAAALAAQGVVLSRKSTGAERRTTQAVEPAVFRPYSGAGGLQEELLQQAAAHPSIAQVKVIGQTIQGQDITAIRVTKGVTSTAEGKRPTTVYVGAQHAREWITPEMVRRLLDRVLDGYGTDREITRLVDATELWFIPVANPDGYDYTFQSEDTRLWRKNLRDNNGDGVIGTGDGTDLNRNYPTRWGYDNEGSSPNPASETYRGATPASEPETQALDALFERITPEFLVNYHSAAELLLYGLGWQVATPSPDDVIYEALAGDDAEPAIPGYDPDIAAELYTTNGDTDSHMQEAYGTLGFTPEMTTCETVSNSIPDDEWLAEDCQSGFNFPDDEELIAAEFEKNVPFALAVGASALDPDDPVSVVGLDAPDFQVDSFTVSYGDPQPVSVVAKKSLLLKRVEYRINNGRTRTALLDRWAGGERYGDENNDYYAEYRELVRGAKPGDTVEVWFSAYPSIRDVLSGNFRKITSERFTYTLAQDSGNSALIIADEDYTGVNPTYPAGTTLPKYLDEHLAALAANGVAADTWDTDAQGVPNDLAVLSHYDTVLWYLGDNRLTQDPEDELTEYGNQGLPDASVAESQQYLTLSVRDFINEGGQLVLAGETSGYTGILGPSIGGIYYGLDGAPDQPCAVTADPFSDCLIVADDFVQYYLGGFSRQPLGAGGVIGLTDGSRPGAFGGPAVTDNPVDEAGAFTVTSDVLPVEQFPQFASEAIGDYVDPTGAVFPVEGEYVLTAEHADDNYLRVSRPVDLTDVAPGDAATFEAQLNYDVEEGYDHVLVEARVAGTDDWTTLADQNGGTSTEVPTECEAGFLLEEHPKLLDYLTLADPCLPTGATGEWNSFTGASDGWQDSSFDLSGFAGEEIELVISYVTDPSTGGAGLAVDDTRLTLGSEVEAEGFESGLGAWTLLPEPEGSPAASGEFERATRLGVITAAVGTDDTVLLGFGLEQLATPAERAAAVKAVLSYLAR